MRQRSQRIVGEGWLMKLAEEAAERLKSWSLSKRDFARRVLPENQNTPRPTSERYER